MIFTRISKLFEKLLSFLISKVNIISAIALTIMVMITVIDVSMRIFLNMPIKGAFELTEFLMLIIVFFTMAYTSRLKSHIIIEVISSKLPKNLKGFIDSISHLISIGFLILIVWQGMIQAEMSKMRNDISGAIGIPIYPFYYILIFGVIVMIFVFLEDFIKSFNHWLKK